MSLAGNIKVGVGPSAKNFWNEFKAQTKANSPSLNVPVHADLSRLRRELALERKRQEANAINMRVRVDRAGMRDVQSLRREVDHIYKVSSARKAIRIQIAVVGAAALPATAQGILSLTTAITQLSRVALVLPGVFASVTAAVGTMAAGFRGVGDALKASGDGMKNNRQYAREYEKATRALERAQRDVVKALKDANREIEDQKDKLQSGALSAEQAQINVQRANERLAQGGFKSMSDWRQAVLDVKQANFDLAQTLKQNKRDIQDYYDNTVKGATQSDTFKNSVDQLNNSLDAYTKAQLQAAGMSEKFIEAMDNLSPKAQMFVRELVGLKDEWRGLTNLVQDNLFDGLGRSITDLSNAQLPMLKRRMGEIATSLNGDFKQLIATVGSEKNASSISKIFDRTAKALSAAKPGLDSFVTAFLHLSEVGSRFLPRFAQAFDTLGKRFDAFINRADADGSLERWINRGIDTINSLFNSLGSLGSIMGSITKAYESATGNFGGFASTLEKTLAKWAETLASPAGQARLRGYIKYAGEFMDRLKEALPGILNLIQGFADGLRAFAAITMPILSGIGNFMSTHVPLIRALVTAWAGIKTVKPIWENFFKVIRKGKEGWTNYRSSIVSAKQAVEDLRNEQAILAQKQKGHQAQYMRDLWAQRRAVNDLERANLISQLNRTKAYEKLSKAENKLSKSGKKLSKAIIADASNPVVYFDDIAKQRSKVDKQKREVARLRGLFDGITAQGAANQVAAAQRVAAASDVVIASQRKLNVSQELGKDITRRLTTAQDKLAGNTGFGKVAKSIGSRGSGGLVGMFERLIGSIGTLTNKSFGSLSRAIGSKGRGGLVGILGGLASAMGGVVAGAIGGLGTIGLVVALDRLSAAQQKAADRAQYHLDKLTALKNAIDPTTGAVTAEGIQQSLGMAQETEITGKGNKTLTVNALDDAKKLGITPQRMGSSFDPTQIAATNEVLNKADANTLSAVRGGKDEQWERIKEDARNQGITDEVYAKALNGDQASVKKFEEYVKGLWKRNPGSLGGLLPMSTALPGILPDLGTGAENLYQTTPGISVGQTTRENLNINADAGNKFKQRQTQANLSAAGKARFPSATDINKQPDGSIAFNVDRLTRQQVEALQNGDELVPNSAVQSLTPLADNGDGTSRYAIVIAPNSPYAGFARGGSVWGAGSATSDSIPAMLSNGEFVINAKSASIIGHDRLNAMNSIQKFAPGGPVKPPKPPILPGGHGSGAKYGSVPTNGVVAGQSVAKPPAKTPVALFPVNIPSSPFVPPIVLGGSSSAAAPSSPAVAAPAPQTGPAYVPPKQDITDPRLTAPGTILTGLDKAGIKNAGGKAGYFGGKGPLPSGGPVPGLKPPGGSPASQSPQVPMTIGQLASVADSLPYVYGGGHPGYAPGSDKPFINGFDCSSLASYVANTAAGLPIDYQVFTTLNQGESLAARGFLPGPGGPGDLIIGWSDSHTAMTLPDGRNLEAANAQDGIILGGTTGGMNFPNVMHLPASLVKNNGPAVANLPLPVSVGGPTPGGSGSSDPDAFKNLSGLGGPSGGQPGGIPNPAPAGAPGGVPGPATAPPIASGPASIPGINAPIPGPFGPIPLQPFDFLKSIGMAILQAIFGFFGIDISGIVGIINGVVGGFAGMGTKNADVPDPNVDPGADPEMVKQLNQMADEARASGDFVMEGQFRQMAKDYQARRAPGDIAHNGSGAAPGPVKKASGGHIRGPGSGTSDSIPAMLSNGEYVMSKKAVDHWGVNRLNAMNSIQKFAPGGPVIPPVIPPITPPPATGSADPQAFQDLSTIDSPGLGEAAYNAGKEVISSGGSLLSTALAPKGGSGGVSASAGQSQSKDPRSIMGQAPTSGDHNNPALSATVSGAFSTIGALAGSAAAAGLGAINGVAPGAGSVAGAAASQVIAAGAQMAGQVANGALNILSSFLVGTATPSNTGQGYGAPLTPQSPQTPISNFQSIHNGNIVTNNLDEYSRLKDRKDAQRAAPFFNRVNA
ncbi:MAG: hypothetical protein ACKODT_08070 [Fluviibacter sp.]